MKKLTGKQLYLKKLQAKKQLKLRGGYIRILQEQLRQDYLSLSSGISKASTKDFGINFDLFQKRITKTLTTGISKITQKQSDYLTNLWGKKSEAGQIETVARKINIDYRKNVGDKAKNITDTARSQLNNVVARGTQAGMSIEQISLNLQSSIIGMSVSKSETIARTETNTVMNKQDYDTAVEVEMKTKTWLHVGTAKVDRENHLALDGETIGIDEEFDLGNGNYAQAPMDENLPAEEVVNCSCLAVYS